MKKRSSSTPDMPDMVDLDEEVWALLEGELDEGAALRVEARIESNPLLATRVAEIRQADAILRALPAPPLRLEARDDLWRRLQTRQGSRMHPFPSLSSAVRRGRAGAWISAAAAAMLAWLVVGHLDEPITDHTDEPADSSSGVGEEEGMLAVVPPGPAIAPGPFVAPGRLERVDPGTASGIETQPIEDELPERIAKTEMQPQRPVPPAPDPAARSDAAQIVAAEDDAVVSDGLASDSSSESSDEEILLALELEVLRDLAVIENLELLEALGPLPGEEPG